MRTEMRVGTPVLVSGGIARLSLAPRSATAAVAEGNMATASSVVARNSETERPGSSLSINSTSELGDFVRDGAAISTAISVKVGTRRGGKKLKASKRGLMGTKVSLLAGGTNRLLLPSRCVLAFLPRFDSAPD